MNLGNRSRREVGIVSCVTAYLIWGVIAEYFKLLGERGVTPMVLLSHRVVWSTVFCIVLLAMLRGLGDAWTALRSPRLVAALAVSAVMVAINWLSFIYSISIGQLSQSALGYFILPLVSVVLGMIVLKERLRPLQWLSVAVAGVGVCIIIATRWELPWIALTIALSFGFYGLVRKMTAIGPIIGLAVETALLTPVAIVYIAMTAASHSSPDLSGSTYLMLIASGVITAIPLLLFVVAAKALKLTTIGFLQYLAPTCQLLLAVFHHHEPITGKQLLGFVPIWLALVIFSVDSAFARRSDSAEPTAAAATTVPAME